MVINNKPVIGPSGQISQKQTVHKQDGKLTSLNFGDILKQKLKVEDGIKFSKHAQVRLQMRNINLNSNQMERIADGVNKAEGKGVKDSLILVDNLALVVNIKNKTVVTAANIKELKENVFTNIDGAVIV